MNLLVIRHAVAEDRETFAEQGKDDSLRPLTDDGRRKMQRAARGIQSMVPSVGVIATSPFVRATQTAQVVGKSARGAEDCAATLGAPSSKSQTAQAAGAAARP